MGDNLLPPREANPKGVFEDDEINRINEALVACAIPQLSPNEWCTSG
jgi:hypothetical protein